MIIKTAVILIATLTGSFVLTAQVQVSKEPLHRKVLENKYLRLMDVWLQPGDTTQFHIHSTPSLFLHFSDASIATQAPGADWVKEQTVPGKMWYRSFSPDSLVHRVCNLGTVPFHVTDTEILSSFSIATSQKPLPFSLLEENEKAFVYIFTKNSFTTGLISNRGPMLAELVSGNTVYYVDTNTKRRTAIKPGGHLYIEPGSSFHFSFRGKEKVNMVLFEIK
jgi:hypothetical protein